jgi:hypothetical protein
MAITYRLLRKDYDYLAKRLVPIGDQVANSHDEIVSLLMRKTRRFTEDEIAKRFGRA